MTKISYSSVLKAVLTAKSLLILLMVSLANVTMAVEVKGLYSAKVPVTSRDRAVFRQGVHDALLLVLQKSSSHTAAEIIQMPSLAADLKNSYRYVEQYSYQTVPVTSADGQEAEQLLLKATFPSAVITSLLQRGNMNYWPANRPALLVMPVVKVDGALHLNDTSINEQAELDLAINNAAFYYGLPLVNQQQLNLMNTQNLRALWLWDVAQIEASARSIKKDATLVGRIAQTSDGRFIGGWMLVQGDISASTDITANSIQEFVHKGFAWLSKRWTKEYAVNFQLTANEQVLHVRGIDTHEKYTRLVTYLEALDVVDHIYILQVEGDQMTLAVDLKADADQFFETIELSRYFKPTEGQLDGANFYDWQLY